MTLALLIALQAAAPAAPRGAIPSDFDLATYKPAEGQGCAPGGGADIVVCGRRRREGLYPYDEMAELFAAKPVVAETGIGGGASARAYVERCRTARFRSGSWLG